MPNIPQKSQFEPNKDALNQWLYTRKSIHHIGGSSIPGLFNDTRYDVDLNWTYIAITGELIGIILTIYGGVKIGGYFTLVSILVVIGLLLLDILCAAKLHRTKARECWIENFIHLYGEDNPKFRNDLLLEKKRWKYLDFFFVVVICIVIVIKIAAVIALGIFTNLFIYIPILIIYLVVGYVHIYHTGYWIAYWKTTKMFRKQFESDKDSGVNAEERMYPFETVHQISNTPIVRSNHKIVEKAHQNQPNEEKKYYYELHTKGILTDKDIIDLVIGQQKFQKLEIVNACKIHQFEGYQLNTKKVKL